MIINDVSDPLLAYYKASSAFVDFIRIILFITNRSDYKYHLHTSNENQQDDNNESILNTRIVYNYYAYDLSNDHPITGRFDENIIKLHISHLLPTKASNDLHKIWYLYQKYHENNDLTDIKQRILSASLAVGESIHSKETNNSIIYTCIALEALFSYDEGQLFQKSIGEKISNCLAFIVGTNKEGRKGIIKHTKEIYSARSALVHGSQPSKSIDLYWINDFIRTAISELLNNKKYKDIKTIKQLYDMIIDAQLSY